VRRELGELLVEERLLDEQGLEAARRRARRDGVPLAVALVEDGKLRESDLLDALERRLKLPRVALSEAFVETDALREVAYDLAAGRWLLPIAVERRGSLRVLRIAMADPLDAEAIEEIESSSGCRVEIALAPPSELRAAVEKHYRGVTTKLIHRGRARGAADENVTQPHHRLEDEAPIELRLRALIAALAEKGVLTDDEYLEALKRLMREE